MDSSGAKMMLPDNQMRQHASLLMLESGNAARPKSILLPSKQMQAENKQAIARTLHPMQSKVFLTMACTLAVTALVNLALEMWVIKILHLGNSGVGSGSMAFVHKGVSIKTPAHFSGRILAKDIAAEGLLQIDGDSSSILTLHGQNVVSIGEGRIEMQTLRFRVRESVGDTSRTLIDVAKDGITTDIESLIVPMGGFAVQQSIHAPVILGMPHQDLSLESRQRSLHILANDLIDLGSKAGPVNVQTSAGVSIQAGNQITFHSRRFSLPGLQSAAMPVGDQSTDGTRETPASALQVCSCEDGRLFATDASRGCRASGEFCNSDSGAAESGAVLSADLIA